MLDGVCKTPFGFEGADGTGKEAGIYISAEGKTILN